MTFNDKQQRQLNAVILKGIASQLLSMNLPSYEELNKLLELQIEKVNLTDLLTKLLVSRYGDYYISPRYGFVAKLLSFDQTRVIMSRSYMFFGDLDTTIKRIKVPIEDLRNEDKFIRVTDYLNKKLIPGKSINLIGIHFALSINDFWYAPEPPTNPYEIGKGTKENYESYFDQKSY